MRNNKKILIVGIITLLVMVGVIGGAFAYFIFANTTESQVLIAGDVFMKYTESNTIINAELMMPRSTYDPETYFEFTIEGKNTYSKDIYYEILINEGDPHATRKTRLDAKFLRFRLEEIVGEEVTPVIEEGTYEEIDNTKIWVNTIASNTKTKTSIKYRLYMWITDEVNISDSGDYTNEKWNNDVYASIKVSVNGDFEEKEIKNGEPAIDIIKATLGLEGGVIGVSNLNQKLTQDNENIREYRYSGLDVNNYVYFNCEVGKVQNNDNCEVWRIIGIFKDESGNEHLKIVKNEKLINIPATYKMNDTEYNLVGGNGAAWNKIGDTGYNNDWSTAGIQYYLNTEKDETENEPNKGYLGTLNKIAKNMIDETAKYYLGTVTYFTAGGYGNTNFGIKDTPNEAYKYERLVDGCIDGIGPIENDSQSAVEGNETCRVWANNSATWTGKVALMYPSDYGYSADSGYWNTSLRQMVFNGSPGYADPSSTSWMKKMPTHYGWLLSPASNGNRDVADWYDNGSLSGVYTINSDAILPTIYLKSKTKIYDGTGEETNPYQLVI